MPKDRFAFKKFTVLQHKTAMKVGTDSVILGACVQKQNVSSILDIGTGSGILALMMAQKYDLAKIEAIEIDQLGFEQAKENVGNSPWSDKIEIYHMSWKEYRSYCQKKFDLIISNPPYYQSSLLPEIVSKSYSRHQVTLTIDELIQGISEILSRNGSAYIILPFEIKKDAIIMALSVGLYCNAIMNIKPFYDGAYNRIILVFEKESKKMEESELVIYSPNSVYTDQFKELTREFYIDLH